MVVAAGDRRRPARRHDPGDGRERRRRRCRRSAPGRAPSAGGSTSGTGILHRAPRPRRGSSGPASRRRRAGSGRTPRRPSPRSRIGSVAAGTARGRRPRPSVSVGVVDQQRAPGLDDGAGVEGLLAVADRQRHEDRRQPDRGGLDDGVGAAAAEHERRRRRRRGPSGRRTPTHGVGHVAGLGASPRPAGPTTCSTWTPASASAADAPETAWLSRRAPCEPPVTSSIGRSGSRPKNRAAPRRACAARSRPRDHRRIGSPTYSAVRQRGVGEADRDLDGDAGAEPCWPGRARRSARGRRAVPCGVRAARYAGTDTKPPKPATTSAPDPVEHPDGVADGAAQPGRDLEQVGVRACGAAARGGTNSSGYPAAGMTRVSSRARVPRQVISTPGSSAPQGVGGGEEGGGVAGGAAAGEQDAHVGVSLETRPGDPAGGEPLVRDRLRWRERRARPRAHGARSRRAGRARRATAPAPSRRRRPGAAGCR